MRKVEFTKMHGAGNDYIYLYHCDGQPEYDYGDLSRKISDRHYGIGSDGLVVILTSDRADFRMRMFNSDGSEAQMCGNASRCIAKYLRDRSKTKSQQITLETKAGIRTLYPIVNSDGAVAHVKVDMGAPVFEPASIPVSIPEPYNCGEIEIIAGDKRFAIHAISMGNPHAVIFTDDLSDENVLGFGPLIENHDIFPERTNVEFVKLESPDTLRVRVWERGAGETMACGTGACASAVAAMHLGLVGNDVKIAMRGGDLIVSLDNRTGHVMLGGGTEFIADGIYYYNDSNEDKQ